MLPRVLFVDDDPLILATFARAFRGRYEMAEALDGHAALERMRASQPFAVIVADMKMPGMEGGDFLSAAQRLAPDTVRIMLTGEVNLATALEAVNKGQVFRFLCKPCDQSALADVIDAAVSQYQLVTSEHILLEQTLGGSVQMLVDLLTVFDPKLFGQARLVREWCLKVAAHMGLRNPWDLGLAALLAPIGRLSVPLHVLRRSQQQERLTLQEEELFRRIPEASARMVAHIPRLQSVARIIKYSEKAWDGSGYPNEALARDAIPLESRILHVLTHFVEALHVRHSKVVVFEQLKLAEGAYDPAVLAVLGELVEKTLHVHEDVPGRQLVNIADLRPGMLLVTDILTPDGTIFLAAGTRLSPIHLERIRSVAHLQHLEEPLLVTVPHGAPQPALLG